jgi:hypothetical protein
MAWFLFVAEVANEDANGALVGTGTYRRIAKSDDGGGIDPLCNCPPHATQEEALNCTAAAAKCHFYGGLPKKVRR